MFSATRYVIHHQADGRDPLRGPALVGEIDGRPAAAISLADGRVVANPFQQTAQLVALLRMRARALRRHERMPAVRDRLRAGVRVQPTGAWF